MSTVAMQVQPLPLSPVRLMIPAVKQSRASRAATGHPKSQRRTSSPLERLSEPTGARIDLDGTVHSPELDALGVELSITEGTDSRGRLCIASITVTRAEGISGALLRQLPMASIQRELELLRDVWAYREHQAAAGEALDRMRLILAERQGPASRRNLPDEFFALVALAYAHELASGSRAPSRAIAEATGTPLATVKGWIHRTRQRHGLPPARRGAAG